MRRVVAGRRSPGPGVAHRRGHHPGVARRLRPRGLQIINVCKEGLATINNTQRWAAALGWLEIGVPGIERGVEKPPPSLVFGMDQPCCSLGKLHDPHCSDP